MSCDFGVIINLNSPGNKFHKFSLQIVHMSNATLIAESDRDKDSDGYDQVGLNQCNSTLRV